LKILVVDDHDEFRGMVRQGLERGGYEVLDATDGTEALHLLGLHPVDVVITDIVMPDMNGLELIRQIRAQFSSVRIIAVSGGGARISPEEVLPAAEVFGAERVFSKPVDLDEMIRSIRDLPRPTDS
jgi:CheY-like chemotaxis protein